MHASSSKNNHYGLQWQPMLSPFALLVRDKPPNQAVHLMIGLGAFNHSNMSFQWTNNKANTSQATWGFVPKTLWFTFLITGRDLFNIMCFQLFSTYKNSNKELPRFSRTPFMGIPSAAFRPICGIIDKLMAVYCSWEESKIYVQVS